MRIQEAEKTQTIKEEEIKLLFLVTPSELCRETFELDSVPTLFQNQNQNQNLHGSAVPSCRNQQENQHLSSQHALPAGARAAAVGARGNAVFGQDGLELLQRGVGSDPGRVKVSPTHPEPGLRQVLKELIQPERREKVVRWFWWSGLGHMTAGGSGVAGWVT